MGERESTAPNGRSCLRILPLVWRSKIRMISQREMRRWRPLAAGKPEMKHGVIAVLFATACALSAGRAPAYAQTFPTRPVTLIAPYAVGGTFDVQLRALAAATEKHLGQPIVIENRPSPTGTLGPAQMAAMAKPDGYTITQISTGVL